MEVRAFGVFLATALVIVGLHLVFHPVRVLGMNTSIFYMDEKQTLAAFFTTVTAFLVGCLAIRSSLRYEGKKKLAGLVYGVFFFVLAADEYFEIHEYANTMIKEGVGEDGLIKNLTDQSWIYSLSVLVVLVFLMLVVKIRLSSIEVRNVLMLGLVCFLGVLTFEFLGSATYGLDVYVYLVALEEGLEMVGVSLFLLGSLLELKKA